MGTPKTALLGRKVTWSSSNDEVVDVDDGDVIALEEGTATITVTVGSRTASCVVTVLADDEYDYDDDEGDYSEGGECLIEAGDDTEE